MQGILCPGKTESFVILSPKNCFNSTFVYCSVATTSCRKYLVVDYNNPLNQACNEFGPKAKAPRKSIVARMATSAQPRASIGPDGRAVLANTPSTLCNTPPPIIFLFVTLLLTISATAMMCVAVLTDHWETITWDRDFLIKLTNNTPHVLHWHLNERVARLPISREYFIGRDIVVVVVTVLIKFCD